MDESEKVGLKFLDKELLKRAVANGPLTAEIMVGLMTDLASAIAVLTPSPEHNAKVLEEVLVGVRALNAEIMAQLYEEEARIEMELARKGH